MEQFWEVRGHLRDGRRWLEAGLQPDRPASLEARAKAMRALGRTAYKMDDFKDAENWHRASRDLYLRLEDTAGLVRVLYNLGYCQARQGNSDAAQAFLDEALPLAHGLDDNYLLSCVLNALAEVADRRGDQALCRQYTEQALALTQARGDPRNSAGLLLNLGLTCYDEGDFATARQHIEASLAAAQALDDQHLIVLGLLNLGNVLIMQNAPAEACVRLEEAIARYKAQHNHSASDAALGALGRALEKLGDLAGARGRHQEALRLRIEAGERRGVAVSLGSLARLDQREGRSQRAAQLLSASQAIREAIGSPISPSSRDEYALLVAAIKTSLGDEAFGPAWAAGHALSQDEAVALALGVPAVA